MWPGCNVEIHVRVSAVEGSTTEEIHEAVELG